MGAAGGRLWAALACAWLAAWPGAQAAGAQAAPREPTTEQQLEQARAHFERGQRAYAEGDLPQAREAFERADALTPGKELAFNLGRVHERLGDSARAISYYERYLKDAGPKAEDLAEVQRRLSALRQAKSQLRAMLKQPPPSSAELRAEARRFFERGMRLFARKRYRGALAAFSAAHSLSKVPELYFNLALTSERLGAHRDAIDYYRAYLAARPSASDRDAVDAIITRLRAKR